MLLSYLKVTWFPNETSKHSLQIEKQDSFQKRKNTIESSHFLTIRSRVINHPGIFTQDTLTS